MANPTGIVTGVPVTQSVQIDSNLTDKEYYFVTLDGTDDNIVNLAAAATAQQFILIEGKDGSSTVKTGTIATGGETKLLIAATIAAGVPIMSDGNGKGIVATDGKYYGATALENGVSGDLIRVKVERGVWKTVS